MWPVRRAHRGTCVGRSAPALPAVSTSCPSAAPVLLSTVTATAGGVAEPAGIGMSEARWPALGRGREKVRVRVTLWLSATPFVKRASFVSLAQVANFERRKRSRKIRRALQEKAGYVRRRGAGFRVCSMSLPARRRSEVRALTATATYPALLCAHASRGPREPGGEPQSPGAASSALRNKRAIVLVLRNRKQ